MSPHTRVLFCLLALASLITLPSRIGVAQTDAGNTYSCADPNECPDPGPPPKDAKLTFLWLHHSVGTTIWVDGGFQNMLRANNYHPYDMYGGEGGIHDWFVPADFVKVFTSDFNTVMHWELPKGRTHSVVAFKLCFSGSII